jgi:hypothetical protein
MNDTGERTEYISGGVREMTADKGRCDLLPLDVLAKYYSHYNNDGELVPDYILLSIANFIHTGDFEFMYSALFYFIDKAYNKDATAAFLELSLHYKGCLDKYPERNWERGLPVKDYISSGVRHYLKYLRHDTDEPHDRAFIWNIVGCIWTIYHHPELNDLPYTKGKTDETETEQPTDYRGQLTGFDASK